MVSVHSRTSDAVSKVLCLCLIFATLDHVRSNTVRIDADEWEIAIFLPVERFQKRSKSYVWSQSSEYY